MRVIEGDLVGVVLAGGAGRRLGGRKPTRMLAGRPLIDYPLDVLAAVCGRVAVVAKASSELPAIGTAALWVEPERPRHPAVGLVCALERAGAPVLVCAADMPFVTPEACRALLAARAPARDAVVATAAGVRQPLLAVYAPSAIGALREVTHGGSLQSALDALSVRLVELPPEVVRSVDTSADLAASEAELRQGEPQPPRPSQA